MAPYVELSKIGMNLKPQKYKSEVKEMFDPHFERARRRASKHDYSIFFDPPPPRPMGTYISKPQREPMENVGIPCMNCKFYEKRLEFYEKILTIVVVGLVAKLLLDSFTKKKGGMNGGGFKWF